MTVGGRLADEQSYWLAMLLIAMWRWHSYRIGQLMERFELLEARLYREKSSAVARSMQVACEAILELDDEARLREELPVGLDVRVHLLPRLTEEDFAGLQPGMRLTLVLREILDSGTPCCFRVEFIHRELIFRTEGQKGEVGFGTAGIEGSGNFSDARMLFSKPDQTATLRGLALEGPVKQMPFLTRGCAL